MSSPFKSSFSIAAILGHVDGDEVTEKKPQSVEIEGKTGVKTPTSPQFTYVCDAAVMYGSYMTPPPSPPQTAIMVKPESTSPSPVTSESNVTPIGSQSVHIKTETTYPSPSPSQTQTESSGFDLSPPRESPHPKGHSSPVDPEVVSPSGSKKSRMCYSSRQISRLEFVFSTTLYPDVDLYEMLSQELNLPTKKIKVWFQNKRARNKRRVSDVKASNQSVISPVFMTPTAIPAGAFPYMIPATTTPPPSPVEMQQMIMQQQLFQFQASGLIHTVPAQYTTSGST